MSTITTLRLRDGSTVRAKIMGQGPPLLLFANMVSWEFWCHQIPVLAQRYRVIAPEYRRVYLPGVTALDALADDVPDLLHGLGYERALLMGHSIGAMVLARMLEKTPKVAAAVVLANGFLHLRVLPGPLHHLQPRLVPLLRAIYPRLPWLARQLGSYTLLWGDQHIFLHREPDSEKRKMFFGYTFTPDASMVLRVGSALEYHEPPDLIRATMPVLVISGGQDRWVSVAQARRLAESLPCGEHLICPSVGHMLPMIVPEIFNRAVLEFFGRAESGVL
ncbi:MAG TPA: alpha/beta hydrolase [Herpetosiphonaceae bacterium]